MDRWTSRRHRTSPVPSLLGPSEARSWRSRSCRPEGTRRRWRSPVRSGKRRGIGGSREDTSWPRGPRRTRGSPGRSPEPHRPGGRPARRRSPMPWHGHTPAGLALQVQPLPRPRQPAQGPGRERPREQSWEREQPRASMREPGWRRSGGRGRGRCGGRRKMRRHQRWSGLRRAVVGRRDCGGYGVDAPKNEDGDGGHPAHPHPAADAPARMTGGRLRARCNDRKLLLLERGHM